jgi:cytochrome c
MKKTPWLSFLSLVLLADVASAALQTTFVASDLRDPMEISLAPNGDVFVVEREGRVLRVVPATGAMFVIGQVPVTSLKEENKNSSWAREDGLLGITLDPDFTKNQRLYLYYSAADQMLNRLSRFSLKDGLLDLSSEKILLCKSNLESSCHTPTTINANRNSCYAGCLIT